MDNKAREAAPVVEPVTGQGSPVADTPAARVFKRQVDAVAFLRERGFKLSASAFCRDLKAGRVSTNPLGHFEEGALLAYAVALKEPTARAEDKALSSATASRLSADAELKRYQAERQRLKLEKEQGLLMPRSDHERDLAARALFFRREVENYIHLYGPGIIHLVGGDEDKLPLLLQHWEETTAVWMDAWSQERSFAVDDPADDLVEEPEEGGAEPEPLSEEGA